MPTTLRVKIIPDEGSVWFASTPQVKRTPEATLAHVNEIAREAGVACRYELATEEQYWAYRNEVRAIINRHAAGLDDDVPNPFERP